VLDDEDELDELEELDVLSSIAEFCLAVGDVSDAFPFELSRGSAVNSLDLFGEKVLNGSSCIVDFQSGLSVLLSRNNSAVSTGLLAAKVDCTSLSSASNTSCLFLSLSPSRCVSQTPYCLLLAVSVFIKSCISLRSLIFISKSLFSREMLKEVGVYNCSWYFSNVPQLDARLTVADDGVASDKSCVALIKLSFKSLKNGALGSVLCTGVRDMFVDCSFLSKRSLFNCLTKAVGDDGCTDVNDIDCNVFGDEAYVGPVLFDCCNSFCLASIVDSKNLVFSDTVVVGI